MTNPTDGWIDRAWTVLLLTVVGLTVLWLLVGVVLLVWLGAP